MRLLRDHRSTDGFTYIEILIVLVIIGILYMAIMFSSKTQVQKGRDSRRKVDMDLTRRGLEEYYDSKNCFPEEAALPGCKQPFALGSTVFMKAMPCDPKSNQPYVYVTDGSGCSIWFQIYTKLEYTTDPIIDTLGCRLHGCGPSCEYNYGVTSTNKPLDVCN